MYAFIPLRKSPLPHCHPFYIIWVLVFLLFGSGVKGYGHGADLLPGFIENLVADSLNPTSMCMDRDGRIFLAQKDGRILIVDKSGILLKDPLVSLNTDVTNERGLQGITLHPDFPDSAYLYAYYAIPGGNKNRVSRFTILGDLVVPGSEKFIVELDLMSGSVHNGGALAFGPQDKLLYISTGEAGRSSNSQDTTNVLGKILRLHADGSIPESNPFYNRFSGKNRAIYALGFRNPFSMTFDPASGSLYVCDVGSGFFEEINIVHSGKNYGWPLIEGKRTNQVEPSEYQDPFFAYPHSDGCAIVGASFYQPATPAFPDSLRNHFFFADYCNGTMFHMDPNHIEWGPMVFASDIHRPISILTAPDGSMYYIAREGQGGGSQEDNKASTDGTLWRITYTGNGKPFISVHPEDLLLSAGEEASFRVKALGDSPLLYQWFENGLLIQGADQDEVEFEDTTPDMNGTSFFCIVTNQHGSDTSDVAILSVTTNTRPNLFIDSPVTGQVYKAGDTLHFSGYAIDGEDGLLMSERLSWRIDFHHNTHTHPAMQTINGVHQGEYLIPKVNETDPSVWYRVHFFATGTEGLSAGTYIDVYPDLADIIINGPPGIEINIDGKMVTLPALLSGVKRLKHIIQAPSHAQANDSTYLWNKFKNGGTEPLFEFIAADSGMVIELLFHAYANGNGTGLLGEYFDDPENDLDGDPQVIRIDSIIDFAWGGGAPAPGFVKNFFSIRWTGWVNPILDGEWTFYVRSDDGSRLWVDDQLLIDEWHGQSVKEYSGTIDLQGGHNYSIRLEYMEQDGGAEVELSWRHVFIEKAIIPKTQFVPARLVGKGNLEGDLWLDENYNAVRDSLEAGMEQVTLFLYRQVDTTFYIAIESDDGFYSFENIREDIYLLQVVYTGSDPEIEPSIGINADGFSPPIFIQTGFTRQYPVAFSRRRGTITGKVWVDTNANGFPEDEEEGLKDVLCIMYKIATGMFSIEQTNAEGIFTCENVDPGPIRLELANIDGMGNYKAGVGLNKDFTTSVFTHSIGEDHFFLLGLEPLTTQTDHIDHESHLLFPNPVHDVLQIKAATPHPSIIRIWNEYGSMALEKYIEGDESNTYIDVSNLIAGIYFIQVKSEKGKSRYDRIVKL